MSDTPAHDAFIAELEALRVDAVRKKLASGAWPPADRKHRWATAWLADQDRAANAASAARQAAAADRQAEAASRQAVAAEDAVRLAREANDIARWAIAIAMIAAVAAIVSAIVATTDIL